MQNWTADGWGGLGYVWTADGAPNRTWPWTADGWLGHFGINLPSARGNGPKAPPGRPRP